MPEFDVVGVGLNATDTLLIVPHFPAYAGKAPFEEEVVTPGRAGGQRPGGVRAAGAAHQVYRHRRGRRARAHPDGKPARGGHQSRARAASPELRQPVGLHRHRPQHRRAHGAVAARRLPAHRPGTDSAGADRLRAPAAYRWARHAGGRARGGHRAEPRDSRHRGRRYHLSRLRPRAAARRLPGGQLRISHGLDRPERSLQGAGTHAARIRNEGGGHDAGGARRAGARKRGVLLLARFRGELRGYHRRRRRVPRGVLLCCFAGNADARRPGVFQRHGGPQLHGAGRARRNPRTGRDSRPDGARGEARRSRIRGPRGGRSPANDISH